MKKSILPALPLFTLFLLLTHPSLSFEGAKNGLLLWWSVVLPTLLPFMLCSSLLVAWGGVPLLVRPFRLCFKRFGLSSEGSYALIAGLLCGYPMGAKTTADFLRNRAVTKKEGQILLAIGGFPSPMFLAGYIRPRLAPELPFWMAAAALYLPLILNGIFASIFYSHIRPFAEPGMGLRPISEGEKDSAQSAAPFDEILMNALEIMVKIGGFLMIYSILAAFITSSGYFPARLKPYFLGFVEMTTGIDAISRTMSGIPASAAILASAAFGGLSGVSQTDTVIKNAGLSIRHYVFWKLLHASLSAAILILLSNLR